jgi:hypothetical protein
MISEKALIWVFDRTKRCSGMAFGFGALREEMEKARAFIFVYWRKLLLSQYFGWPGLMA